jgi:hypothetical protein
MPTAHPIQFVRETRIDDEVSDEAAIVRFATEQEKERYVALDTQLIEKIKYVYESFSIREGDGVHHIEDWWHNHLRGVECDPMHFRIDILARLQELLTGDWARWRIIIHYYGGLSGAAACGSALVLSDRVLATTEMKGHLK